MSHFRDVLDSLDWDKEQELLADFDGEVLHLRVNKVRRQRLLPTWLILAVTLCLTLLFGVVTFYLGHRQVPLSGDYSISSFLLGYGGFMGLLTFATNFIYNRKDFLDGLKSSVFWRMFPIILVAFEVILLLLLLGLTWALEQLFSGASFDVMTASLILGAMTFAVSIFWGQLATRLRATWLSTVFTIVMVSGVVIAMATNRTRQWWLFNLSFLGTQKARDSWQFNITLILAAFILIALVDYLFVALSERYPKDKRILTLRLALTLLGLDLAAVGYFPNDAASHIIHTRFAGYLVYIIIFLIIGVKWLLPEIDRDFWISSLFMGGFLVALEIAFAGIHYLSLTAFEMIAFIVCFTWLMLLFNYLDGLIKPKKQTFVIDLSGDNLKG